MVWHSFSAYATSRLHMIEGRMKSKMYQDILDRNLLPSTRMLKIKRKWACQQDKAARMAQSITQL